MKVRTDLGRFDVTMASVPLVMLFVKMSGGRRVVVVESVVVVKVAGLGVAIVGTISGPNEKLN